MHYNLIINIMGFQFLFSYDSYFGAHILINQDTLTVTDEQLPAYAIALKQATNLLPEFEFLSSKVHYDWTDWRLSDMLESYAGMQKAYALAEQNWKDTKLFTYIASNLESCQKDIRAARLKSFNFRPDLDKEGFVYILDAKEKGYKIGCTANPNERLKGLRGAYHKKAEYVQVIPVDSMAKSEYALHRHFVDKHIHGEFFNLSQEDIQSVMEVLQ